MNVRQRGLKSIKLLEPPLARLNFYLYMHKKHATMIPDIARAIREMKGDGTQQRIYESVRLKLGL